MRKTVSPMRRGPSPRLRRVSPAEQIVGMIKEQEAGLPTAELCRKPGLSPVTFYRLKAKYGGMDLPDTKRLKQLEDEDAGLKRLVAGVVLANVVLKNLPGKS